MSHFLVSGPTSQQITQYLVTIENDVDMPSVPEELGGGLRRLKYNLDAYTPGTISATAKACNVSGCSPDAPALSGIVLTLQVPDPPTDLDIETE